MASSDHDYEILAFLVKAKRVADVLDLTIPEAVEKIKELYDIGYCVITKEELL